MILKLQVITAHPLVAQYLVGILSADASLRSLLTHPSTVDFDSLPRGLRGLFIVDTHFLPLELSKLTRLMRVRCPESKFLALAAPLNYDEGDLLRMLYLGIEGIVMLSNKFKAELPVAVRSVLAGNLWAPSHVVAQYVRQITWIRSENFQTCFFLTSRERQVLQMLIRRLSNQEVAEALGISERTVKFHVSNILAKLQVKSRAALLTALNRRYAEVFS